MGSEDRSAELRRKATELEARSAEALRKSAALRAASGDLLTQAAECRMRFARARAVHADLAHEDQNERHTAQKYRNPIDRERL